MRRVEEKADGWSTKSCLYGICAKRMHELAAAEMAVGRASDARRSLSPGSSRAKITTANARWATKCEARDRLLVEVTAVLNAVGLIGDEDGVHEV